MQNSKRAPSGRTPVIAVTFRWTWAREGEEKGCPSPSEAVNRVSGDVGLSAQAALSAMAARRRYRRARAPSSATKYENRGMAGVLDIRTSFDGWNAFDRER